MRTLIAIAALVALTLPPHAEADLAQALCQDPYASHYKSSKCTELLIGNIDAIQAYGDYCPDGNTSFGYIIATWHRLLKKDPSKSDLPTAISLKLAIESLDLDCNA